MDHGLQLLFDARSNGTGTRAGHTPPPSYATSLQTSWTTDLYPSSLPVKSSPPTPNAFDGVYYNLDLANQPSDLSNSGSNSTSSALSNSGSISNSGSFLHSKSGSESGSSLEESLGLFMSPSSDHQVLQHHSQSQIQFSRHQSPAEMQLAQAQQAQRQSPHHVGLGDLSHQTHHANARAQQARYVNHNQPYTRHLGPASLSPPSSSQQLNGMANQRAYSDIGNGSLSQAYVKLPLAGPRNAHSYAHAHSHHQQQQQQQMNALRTMSFPSEWTAADWDVYHAPPHQPLGLATQPQAMLYAGMDIPGGFQDMYRINLGINAQIEKRSDLPGHGQADMSSHDPRLTSSPMNFVHSGLSMGVGSIPTNQAQAQAQMYGEYPALSFAISQFGRTQAHSTSSTSTPSLAGGSPGVMSPEMPSSAYSTATANAPGLFHVGLMPPRSQSRAQAQHQSRQPSIDRPVESPLPVPTPAPTPAPTKTNAEPKPARNAKAARKKSSPATTSSAPVNDTPSSTVEPAPVVEDIPLHLRVAAMKRDKRIMFERACGDRWNKATAKASADSPKASSSTPEDEEETKKAGALRRLLEALYALIGSEELEAQLEIPDSLVRPILESVPLPKAAVKKGSRGGAAGYMCQWEGCSKDLIKRLDHAKNHVREHCKSKPHTCGGPSIQEGASKGCGQKFLRMDDLKRHQKSHCAVLRSGPGRRPRSVRGVYERESEDEASFEEDDGLSGGDDDDYRPVGSSSSTKVSTRELASRLRAQRAKAARAFSEDLSTSEDEELEFGRLQTSHVRGGPADEPQVQASTQVDDDDFDDGMEMRMDGQDDDGLDPGVNGELKKPSL